MNELVNAVRDYSGTFNVTDYRWLNLRDSNSSEPAGSLPGAATTFATDGLLRDDYSAKPAFAAYRALIAADGQPTPPKAKPLDCRSKALRLTPRHERRPIRRIAVFLGKRRIGHASGHRLRVVRISRPRGNRFTVRVVLMLAGGKRVVYRQRYRFVRCHIVAGR
ncbi:MAG: hypothetical protein WBQ18_00715 [Solirubrobacteraceae bacterium]